jgi:23S rRNA pseudouridine2605 synthase
VDGENFQPMIVTLDRVQGMNAWLTVSLREGKNREIRRAMTAINLTVNRLIRVSYGPFRLGELEPGEVEEVRPKVLRDQLGTPDPAPEKPARKRGPTVARPPAGPGTPPRAGKSAAARPDGKPPAKPPARPRKPAPRG